MPIIFILNDSILHSQRNCIAYAHVSNGYLLPLHKTIWRNLFILASDNKDSFAFSKSSIIQKAVIFSFKEK